MIGAIIGAVGAVIGGVTGVVKQGHANDKANADRQLAVKGIWAQQQSDQMQFISDDAKAEQTLIIIAIVSIFLFAFLMIYHKKKR